MKINLRTTHRRHNWWRNFGRDMYGSVFVLRCLDAVFEDVIIYFNKLHKYHHLRTHHRKKSIINSGCSIKRLHAISRHHIQTTAEHTNTLSISFAHKHTHTHGASTHTSRLQIAKHLFSTDLMIMIFGKFVTIIMLSITSSPPAKTRPAKHRYTQCVLVALLDVIFPVRLELLHPQRIYSMSRYIIQTDNEIEVSALASFFAPTFSSSHASFSRLANFENLCENLCAISICE